MIKYLLALLLWVYLALLNSIFMVLKTIIMQRNGNSVTPFMVEGREPTYKKRFMFYQVIEKPSRASGRATWIEE